MTIASRKNRLIPHVVFVDGLSGTGKTALLLTLSSFERMEMARFEHPIEYACGLNYLKRITPDAASTLIRLQLDIACYNTMISRHVNFRPTDISAVTRSKKSAKYFERLFLPDHEDVIQRLEIEGPIFQIMTHALLGISEPLFEALSDNFTFIEIIRNPIFMIPAWDSHFHRYGTDPLSFALGFDHQGVEMPWFAFSWKEKFLNSSKMDRIILSIVAIDELKKDVLSRLSPEKKLQVLQIPFESFVSDPWPIINMLETKLNAQATSMTEKVLKEQNIPRKISMDVPENEVFKKYGYLPLQNQSSEENEKQKVWDEVKAKASPECLDMLRQLSRVYEDKYSQ